MATAFQPLDEQTKPQTLQPYDTPLPSISDFIKAPQAEQQPLASNPDIPKPIANLAEQGSNVSTLSQILAWVAAARGDFRGLQSIEENKRRTALGKSLHPRMLKINDLTTTGKWQEAAKEAEAIVGEYGPVAGDMMPYFKEMRDSIRRKQEGWQALKTLVASKEDVIKPGMTQYPYLQMLKKSLERQDQWSLEMLLAQETRNAPHIQVLDKQVVSVDPLTQGTQITPIPQAAQAGKFDDFISMRLAGQYGLTGGNQLANIMNDIPVQTSTGETIQPGSPEAMKIKQQYSALLPVQAQIDVMKSLAVDPATAFQMIVQLGPMNALLRNMTPAQAESVKRGVAETLGMQEEERQKAILRTDPGKAAAMGVTNVDFDPTSPTYLEQLGPMTQAEVAARGGMVGQPDKELYNTKVQPMLRHMRALDIIPTMVEGNTPTTRSSQLTGAINDRLTQYFGRAMTAQSDVRANVKAILAEAINAAESVRAVDSAEIGLLRRMAANPFNTNEDILAITRNVKERLSMAIRTSIGGFMQPGAPVTPAAPPTVRGRTTQEKAATPKGATSAIDPELDRQLQAVEENARKNIGPRGGTITVPAQPVPGTQPAAPQTPQAEPYDEQKEAQRAYDVQQQQKKQAADTKAAKNKAATSALAEKLKAQEAATAAKRAATEALQKQRAAAEAERERLWREQQQQSGSNYIQRLFQGNK